MMTETVRVAAPRKGCPLEAALERFVATESIAEVTDKIISTLRYEKSIMKSHTRSEHDVYERLADYSDLLDPAASGYTLLRDDRDGMPRRIVFDNVVLEVNGVDIHLVGRKKSFRALRIYELGPGFDSADLVLEEVVKFRPEGPGSIEDVNACTDPMNTDVRVVSDLGDTVYHMFMVDPELSPPSSKLDCGLVTDYAGDLRILPHYERLAEAVLGAWRLDDMTFAYPNGAPEEEAAIAETGTSVYPTMTGPTACEHGLVFGEHLFSSETVLVENVMETTPAVETVRRAIVPPELETGLKV